MPNSWVTNVQDVILFDLRYEIFTDFVVHNLHELLLFDCKAGDHLVRFVEEFGDLVVEASEVSDHALVVFEIFGPEGVIEEPIANKYATLHDVKDLINFVKLVLNETVLLGVSSGLKAAQKLDEEYSVLVFSAAHDSALPLDF